MISSNAAYGPCPACGAAIYHTTSPRHGVCALCGKEAVSYYTCENAHVVCDHCMLSSIHNHVLQVCESMSSTNPFEIAEAIMDIPEFGILGCRNSIVPSLAMIVACKNAGVRIPDLSRVMANVESRLLLGSSSMCRMGGVCGIPLSCSAGLAVILFCLGDGIEHIQTSIQKLSSDCLAVVGAEDKNTELCCKRHVYQSLKLFCAFLKKHKQIELSVPEHIVCKYSDENPNCGRTACSLYNRE